MAPGRGQRVGDAILPYLLSDEFEKTEANKPPAVTGARIATLVHVGAPAVEALVGLLMPKPVMRAPNPGSEKRDSKQVSGGCFPPSRPSL